VGRGPFAIAGVVFLLLVPVSTAAWAAGERARLELTRDPGAASCPDAEALANAVASRLGYDPFDPEADLRMSVHFLREGSLLRGVVEMRTAVGEPKGDRALASSAADCQELAEATALTISILLDPRSGLGPRPPRAPTAPTPAEVPDLSHPSDPTASPGATAVVPPSPKKEGAPVRPRFIARGTGSIGLLPSLTGGLLAGVGFETGRWSLDAELRIDASSSKEVDGHEVSASFFAGGLAPCLTLFGPLRACGVVVLGSVQANVAGASEGRQNAFMLLLGPRLGGALPLTSWLSLDAHVDLLFAPTQLTVEVDTNQHEWATPLVSGLLGAGLVGRIP
jgi:hypothetical protein